MLKFEIGRFFDFFFLVVPLMAFCLSFSVSFSYQYPVGVDVYEHFKIADFWLNGNVTGLLEYPYPPMFHWLLVPFVASGTQIGFARLLQSVCYPLSVLGFMFLCWKHVDKRAAVWCGALLLGCFAFFDRVIQAQPQALDFVLLPVAFDAVLDWKPKRFALVSFLLMLNHAPMSLVALIGAYAYSVVKHRHELRNMMLIMSPLFLVAAFLLAYLSRVDYLFAYNFFVSQNAQESAFWSNPLVYALLQFAPLFPALPLAFRQAFRWRSLSELEKLSLLTLAGLLLLVPSSVDRFWNYATIPLSILLACYHNKWKWLVIPVVLVGVCVPWIYLFANAYYVVVP